MSQWKTVETELLKERSAEAKELMATAKPEDKELLGKISENIEAEIASRK